MVAARERSRHGVVAPSRKAAATVVVTMSGLFWRVFAVNACFLALVALLLIVTPVTISAPIAVTEAALVVLGLAIALLANAVLLRRVFTPLERLVRRMEVVDPLRPGERLEVERDDEIGRVVGAFNRMLDRLESERRESATRVLAAQEAERLGIARDLHDEVGQVLTGVLLQLGAIEAHGPAGRESLEEARGSVRRALEEVRRISRELRPEMLEELGLVSALTELTRTFARTSGVEVERRFGESLPQLAPATELAVYRVAQESLTNVARHARATRVDIALEPRASGIVLVVRDDGRGLGAAREEQGGLRSMRERAVLVGGRLAVRDAPSGGGVEVELEVPALDGALAAKVGR
jgi:two-component system sensor histidine kinase UhpB